MKLIWRYFLSNLFTSFFSLRSLSGALLDNIGSTGLFPLCLSPLALQTFYATPSPPIMSVVAYQWLSVCVALLGKRLTCVVYESIQHNSHPGLVIPSTQCTPWAFNNIGVVSQTNTERPFWCKSAGVPAKGLRLSVETQPLFSAISVGLLGSDLCIRQHLHGW